MSVLKNKTFWLMLFIVALGTFLRLIFIDKPDGLWNDEYVSWAIASIPLGKKFVNAVFAQCHMPFYYFYLKFFIHFFGNSDLMLRLTSVLAGVLSIIPMYFVGKEFKDNRLGILCAAVTSLSSFLIYFSQEVRFYGLLFLFASLSLLFTIKLCKKQSLPNFIFYIISNFLIIFTHSVGFVFVFFNLILMSYCLLKIDEKYKKSILVTWSALLLLGLINLPLLFKIFTAHPLSQWWGTFSLSKFGFLITDYFSPMLTNIVSAPDNFFYNFNLIFIIFAILPSIIAIVGIAKSLMAQKNPFPISRFPLTISLFYMSLAYVLVLILAAIFGKLMFITKYSMEIYPILILLMCFGLLEFKKAWRYFLIFAFCFLNLFYILESGNSAPKMHRSEGHKIVASLIQNATLNSGDFILLNYYPKGRFEKYFDFSKYNVTSIDKNNYFEYLGIEQAGDFKKVDDKHFSNKLKSQIDKLKSGQKIAVVILNDVAIYSPVQMQMLKNDDKAYKKAPFFFLVFSYIKNKTLEEFLKDLQIVRIESKGTWSIVTFQKP